MPPSSTTNPSAEPRIRKCPLKLTRYASGAPVVLLVAVVMVPRLLRPRGLIVATDGIMWTNWRWSSGIPAGPCDPVTRPAIRVGRETLGCVAVSLDDVEVWL